MRKSVLSIAAVLMLSLAWYVGLVQGQQGQGVVFQSAAKAKFEERQKGVSMATIWGNPDAGAHATFTKFAPGYDAGMHSHTNDVWIVGIKGAYVYKDDAGEKRAHSHERIRARIRRRKRRHGPD